MIFVTDSIAMKKLAILCLLLAACTPKKIMSDPATDEQAIRQVLADQQKAWNNGDIDTFMNGYWKSDSLLFVGQKIARGWDSTLVRYHRSYPDRKAMGQLTFTFDRFDRISADSYVITGKYLLVREHDQPTGYFTLVVQRRDGRWVIIHDHTS